VHITEECRKLQDTAPPFGSERAWKIIADELGRPLDEIFERLDPEPLAAASIGQVHRAKLRNGAEVIIKVQRPNLDRVINTDMDILHGLAELVEERLPEARIYNPVQLISEFGRNLKSETNLRREASNIAKFAELYKEDPDVIVPRVFRELTTEKVLVEEYIDGIRADDVERLEAAGVDTPHVIDVLSSVVLTSIFEHRFFHADPHPGNVLVTRDGRVALIDFGSMGRLDRSRLYQTVLLLVATITKDPERMIRVLRESQMVNPDLDESALKVRLIEILELYLDESLGSLDLARLLADVFDVVRSHGIRPPPDLLLVGKALTTVEFIGARLDPNYQPVASIRPYLMRQYAAMLLDPKVYADYAITVGDNYRRFLTDFPGDIRLVARQLARGELAVGTFRADRRDVERTIHRVANRAIVMFVATALMCTGAVLFATHADHTVATSLLIAGGGLLLVGISAVARTGGMS
jgi:ubiquinone biosynthesis protein